MKKGFDLSNWSLTKVLDFQAKLALRTDLDWDDPKIEDLIDALTGKLEQLKRLLGGHTLKPVKSTDPRKPVFMKLLKQVSLGSKVTMVREDAEYVYGSCFELGEGRKYIALGEFKVKKGI